MLNKLITTSIMFMLLMITTLSPVYSRPSATKYEKLPENYISHTFDGRAWYIVNQSITSDEMVSQMVLRGEELENWTELITAHAAYQHAAVAELAEIEFELYSKLLDSFTYDILETSETYILFTWAHRGSKTRVAQRQVKKISKGTDGIYSLAYTVNEKNFSKPKFEEWVNIIRKSKLKRPAK